MIYTNTYTSTLSQRVPTHSKRVETIAQPKRSSGKRLSVLKNVATSSGVMVALLSWCLATIPCTTSISFALISPVSMRPLLYSSPIFFSSSSS